MKITKNTHMTLWLVLMVLSSVSHAGWSKSSIKQMVKDEADRQNFPVEIAMAVAETESNFDPYAESHVGARGVMQIMPKTAREDLGVDPSSLYNPRVNIRAGIKFLKHLVKAYDGRYDIALSHYNGGSRVRRPDGTLHVMKATEAYVGKVFKRAKKYKGLNTTRTQIASTRQEKRKSDRIWDSLALENDVNRRSSTHFEPKDLPRYDFTQQERERLSQRLASLAKHNAKRKPRETPVSKPLGRKRLAQMDYPSRLELVRQWDSF